MKINYSTWYNIRTNMRRIFLIAVVALAAYTVNAGSTNDSSGNEPTLTTMGIANGVMSFSLKYNNVKGERLEIILKDKEGHRLYKEIIKDKSLNKTFKIEPDIKAVTLIITNLNTKTEQKFDILNHTRTIEKLIVTSTY